MGAVQAAPRAGAVTPGRLFELLLGVLHRLAERGPLLLAVEDLHWADQSTRDLAFQHRVIVSDLPDFGRTPLS